VKVSQSHRKQLLAGVPLFSGASKAHLGTIAAATEVRSFEEGERIVREGTPGRVFHVILDGRVSVMRGGRTLGRLLPGEFFGEMAVLLGGPRTATVVGETSGHLLTLDGRELDRVVHQEPTVAVRILQELARRLDASETGIER